jgi:hypothetical protein
MARTIIFYGTLYIAALMLAVDTGIKRSPDVLAKLPFVKSVLWGFLPLFLLLIFGLLAIHQYFYPTEAMQITIQQQNSQIESLTSDLNTARGKLSHSEARAQKTDGLQRQSDQQRQEIADLKSKVQALNDEKTASEEKRIATIDEIAKRNGFKTV